MVQENENLLDEEETPSFGLEPYGLVRPASNAAADIKEIYRKALEA